MRKRVFVLLLLGPILFFNFTSISYALDGSGAENEPYLITSFEDFKEFSNDPNYWAGDVHTRLDCDLDLDPALIGRQTYTTAAIAPDADNTNRKFDGATFSGIFDGNGFNISGLSIDTNGEENDYLGLFGCVSGIGQVMNLGIDVSISALNLSEVVGALCGKNEGIIINCYSTGAVVCGNKSYTLGGLCGDNYPGTIIACFATVSVIGGDDACGLGGLAGGNSGGLIDNCYATGSVTGGDRSCGLGGLCGDSYESRISECYATGQVYGGNDSENIGGLCGDNYSVIMNCYSTGLVTGDSNVGGLVGDNFYGDISYSYAEGTVNGLGNNIGGLVGFNEFGIITDSFCSGDTIGNSNVGGLCGNNLGGKIGYCYVDGNIQGQNTTGGLVGRSTWGMLGRDKWNPGKIYNCCIKGTVQGNGYTTGGLVGYCASFTIRCFTACDVNGDGYVGGLMGSQEISSVLDCYSTGSVSGRYSVGGLIGRLGFVFGDTVRGGNVYRCYSSGEVDGSDNVGGLLGEYHAGYIDSNSFWNIESSGQEISAGGTGKTTLEMQNPDTFINGGWDFEKPIWTMHGYPALIWNYPDLNRDGKVDFLDYTHLAALWTASDCFMCEGVDLSGDQNVNIDDLLIFSDNWLWQDTMSNHIFDIRIENVWDYNTPDNSSDDTYNFNLHVWTSEDVFSVEFTTPAGNTFKIPNVLSFVGTDLVDGHLLAGKNDLDYRRVRFRWVYEFEFDDISSLNIYGDGLYTFNFTYEDGRQHQTTAWFGIPGTSDPITQPVNEPQFTSFSHNDVLTSPVDVAWDSTQNCLNIPDGVSSVKLMNINTSEKEKGEFTCEDSGVPELLDLSEGLWKANLIFGILYDTQNSDGIGIEVSKQAASEYNFTVVP